MTDRTTPQEASRAAFEAWSQANGGFTLDRYNDPECTEYVHWGSQLSWQCWQAATQARDAQVLALRDALALLCRNFPTDHDMVAAGWSHSQVNEACDAYETARALVLKGEKL